MRNIFAAKLNTDIPDAQAENEPSEPDIPTEIHCMPFAGYLSDLSSDDEYESADDGDDESEGDAEPVSRRKGAPPLKRQKLAVPRRVARERIREAKMRAFEDGLVAMDKLLNSKKTKFVAGARGLQARRALAIHSHLTLIVKSEQLVIEASEQAAESHGFARRWGGRQLRSWTRQWITKRQLPTSEIGQHRKVSSLLDDPVIATELRSYVRSKKWAMDPKKLAQFSQDKLIPDAANKYLRHITQEEMPRGLKKYMELELFPRIHVKVGKGISLSTARRWLHREGFRYTGHKKGLYFDGHDRPDVVSYRQDHFLPRMKSYEPHFIRYVVGDVELELLASPPNYVETRKVLVVHDEMTAQSNDAKAKSWVFENQHMLRKKGVGRGLHQSDVICSTVGWLKDASQTIEYGKNYDGYWTGEMFVNQVIFEICYTQ
jgi:hypothetical protein